MHQVAPSIVFNCIPQAEKLELRHLYMQSTELQSEYPNLTEFFQYGLFVVARAMIEMKD